MALLQTNRPFTDALALVGSLLSIALGLLVLLGWYTHNVSLVQVHPTFVPMQYNTALGFLLCGSGLLLLRFNRPGAALLFGIAAQLVGGLTLIEYLAGVDLGIDQIFMEHYITVQTSHPGRMAPNTALCFTLTGMGVFSGWLLAGQKRHSQVVGILGALVFALGAVALAGYPFHLETAYGWGNLTRMAIHTASGFVVLGVGLVVFAWNRDTGSITIFPNWFPTLVGIGSITLSLALWQAYAALESGSGNPLAGFSTGHAHDALLIFGMVLSVVLAFTFHYYQVARQQATLLQREREQFKALVESTSDWIWEMDTRANFTYASPRVKELLGYEPGEVVGTMSGFDLMPREEAEKIRAEYESFVTAGQPFERMINVNVHKNGHPVIMESSGQPFFDESGKLLGYRGIDRDITERRRAEEALRESEQKFLRLFMEVSIPLCFVDKDGILVHINHRFTGLFGYTLEDVPTLEEWWPRAYPDERYRQWVLATWGSVVHRAMAERADIESNEYEVTCKNGDVKTILIGGVLFGDDFLATFIDVTDRKKAERELERAKQLAETANAAKSRFLATMSHEIRTPLNTIIGIGDILSEMASHPEQRRYLAVLAKAGEALLSLINDILDLSKIEAGEMTLETTSFDLVELVEGTTGILAGQARDKGLIMDHAIDGAVPSRLRGDPQRVRQVLLNLLGNAIKFTETGTVHLQVTMTGSGHHLFAVSDTGVGISPRKQETIFEPFTQADDTVTRRFGGTGLGLAICRQLAEAMAGKIRVESQLGKGSTFYFSIPFPRADTRDGQGLTRATRSHPRGAGASERKEADFRWCVHLT